MKNNSTISFKSPVVCVDPVTKGTFTITRAWITNYFWDSFGEDKPNILQATGSIVIEGQDNPLYSIIRNTPLKLQGLMGSADFGVEKKFVQIIKINRFLDLHEESRIDISNVTFEILSNLDYLERIQEYKDGSSSNG